MYSLVAFSIALSSARLAWPSFLYGPDETATEWIFPRIFGADSTQLGRPGGISTASAGASMSGSASATIVFGLAVGAAGVDFDAADSEGLSSARTGKKPL